NRWSARHANGLGNRRQSTFRRQDLQQLDQQRGRHRHRSPGPLRQARRRRESKLLEFCSRFHAAAARPIWSPPVVRARSIALPNESCAFLWSFLLPYRSSQSFRRALERFERIDPSSVRSPFFAEKFLSHAVSFI